MREKLMLQLLVNTQSELLALKDLVIKISLGDDNTSANRKLFADAYDITRQHYQNEVMKMIKENELPNIDELFIALN